MTVIANPRIISDEWIREAFPVLSEVTYVNVGTYGIMPEPALKEYLSIVAEFESRGVASDGRFGRKTEETRRRIAEMIGAEHEEIAFTRNATDGINLVLAGINWQPGDEVITTVQEHEAMMHPLLYLHRTRGLNIKMVDVSPNAEVMIRRIEEQTTPKTRLIAMSLVTCESGTRLPGKVICRWAAEQGVLSLFDGAQASGVFPVNVREMGFDFYASNGHKWLSGPKGSGFFYARRDRLHRLSPAHVGAGSLQQVDIARAVAEPFQTGQRFEFGTRAWAISAGLGASLDWFEKVGWARLYGHIAALSDHLKACIQERSYLGLITPLPFDESSGLTSFTIANHNAAEVGKQLREEWKIYVRVIPHYNAIRVSTAHFNHVKDIERLLEALDTIAKRA